MNKIKYSFNSSTLWCAAIFAFYTLSCCNEGVPVNPYRWELAKWEDVYIDPVYENGYYYVFSADLDTKQSSLTKIKEIDGKVMYSVPFKVNVDLDLRRSSSTFKEGGRLMFVEGKYIHQFNMNTGKLIATDTFSNFIWNFQWTKDHLTACSYKNLLITFKYYEIVYENNHYKEKLIHEEYYDSMNNGNTNGGSPPIYSKGKWMMTYFTFLRTTGECKNYLIIKDGENLDKKSIGYDNNKGNVIGGTWLVDDDAMYIYCVDKLFAFDRTNQSIKWSSEVVGVGLNKIIGDFIYGVHASDIHKMSITNRYTGQTSTIDSSPAWSGQSDGDYLCWTYGEFQKFNTRTRKFEFVPSTEKSELGGWEYSLGVSPNSKLLFDGRKLVCYPF